MLPTLLTSVDIVATILQIMFVASCVLYGIHSLFLSNVICSASLCNESLKETMERNRIAVNLFLNYKHAPSTFIMDSTLVNTAGLS